MENSYLSAKEVVERYGISYSSLNYYTNLGLFDVKKRSGNTRFYDAEEVRRSKDKINELINNGYPLRIIRKILETA